MNIFRSLCESLYNRTVREAKLRGIFFNAFFFTQFTQFVFKSLVIVVESIQK